MRMRAPARARGMREAYTCASLCARVRASVRVSVRPRHRRARGMTED